MFIVILVSIWWPKPTKDCINLQVRQ